MGRPKGSRNKSTIAMETEEKESKNPTVTPVKPVETAKVVYRNDSDFLIAWLEGVKKEYKEDKKAHQEALQICNEIIKYIKKHNGTYEAEEASNPTARNDTATD